MKVQAESFHLNGHIIGFHPQTQKSEWPYKTPSNTLAVKGLTQFSQCLTETRFNPFLVCRTLLCRHHLAWKVSFEHIRWTRKAFIFLKEPTKEEIWTSKDLLNSGISWTSFKKTYPISFICEVAKMINWRTNEEDLNHNRRLQLNFSSWHKHLQTTIIMKPCTFEFK